jgi:hypothetical protein
VKKSVTAKQDEAWDASSAATDGAVRKRKRLASGSDAYRAWTSARAWHSFD